MKSDFGFAPLIAKFDAFNNAVNYTQMTAPTPPPRNPTLRPDLLPGIPDGILTLILPVAAYWIFSTVFHIIDITDAFAQWRIHPSEEVQKRNKATLSEVIHDVVVQHVIQTAVGLAVYYFDPPQMTGFENYEMWSLKHGKLHFLPPACIYVIYYYGISAIRIFAAFVVIDTWQYFLHRLMHVNKYLYKHFHSRHHRLYVPYAYGALYNAPFEGFLLDTVGTGVAGFVTGINPREAMVLYVFSTLKTVDDHCGYCLPFDPFQILFPNNAVYHDIHHQAFGIKTNFSQPFFTFWDSLLNTRYHGTKGYHRRQKEISREKYEELRRGSNEESSDNERKEK